MSELVIDFKSTGAVESLHMDGFDLGFLGEKKVRRQTDIVFNEKTQAWDIWYLYNAPGGEAKGIHDCLRGFPDYETARRAEVAWINDCRLGSILPMSADGLSIMQDIRDAQ